MGSIILTLISLNNVDHGGEGLWLAFNISVLTQREYAPCSVNHVDEVMGIQIV